MILRRKLISSFKSSFNSWVLAREWWLHLKAYFQANPDGRHLKVKLIIQKRNVRGNDSSELIWRIFKNNLKSTFKGLIRTSPNFKNNPKTFSRKLVGDLRFENKQRFDKLVNLKARLKAWSIRTSFKSQAFKTSFKKFGTRMIFKNSPKMFGRKVMGRSLRTSKRSAN